MDSERKWLEHVQYILREGKKRKKKNMIATAGYEQLWMASNSKSRMFASLKSVSMVRTIGRGSTELEQYNIDWESEMMAIGVETVEVTSSPWLYMPQLILHQSRISANKYLVDTYRTRGNISAFQPIPP